MARLVIFGTGGFGRELVRIARETCGKDPQSVIFASDHPSSAVMGIPVISADEIASSDNVVVAVGDSRVRRQISERLNGKPGALLSPTALIGPDVTIGPGAVICDYSIVTASATIGKQFQCNIYSYVAHDCIIGDYVTFAPRVCCNGNVHIGDGAYLGTNATIKQGTADVPLVIGENAIIGMGAVVTKNVPAGAIVVGNPARPRE